MRESEHFPSFHQMSSFLPTPFLPTRRSAHMATSIPAAGLTCRGNSAITPLGTGLLQISDHKACVDALVTAFHLDHDAARAHPRPGLVTRRVKACDLVPTSFIGALGLL